MQEAERSIEFAHFMEIHITSDDPTANYIGLPLPEKLRSQFLRELAFKASSSYDC